MDFGILMAPRYLEIDRTPQMVRMANGRGKQRFFINDCSGEVVVIETTVRNAS